MNRHSLPVETRSALTIELNYRLAWEMIPIERRRRR